MYETIRNYFIAELIIPNRQRAGNIPGKTIQEVDNAQNDTTNEGYHRVMIAGHKTSFCNQQQYLFTMRFIYDCSNLLLKSFLIFRPFQEINLRKLSVYSLVTLECH